MTLLCSSIVRGTLEDVKQYFTFNNCLVADMYNMDPIVLACLRGDEDIVRYVLTAGSFLPVKHKETAVMMSAADGKKEIVRALLESGVSTQMEKRLEKPLHTAAIYGNTEAVELFLEFGFRADEKAAGPTPMFNEEGKLGEKLKEYMNSLEWSRGIPCELPWVLTPLSWACLLGHAKVVDVLFKNDPEPWTHSPLALHLAAIERKYSTMATVQETSDHEKVVQLLLDKGYDVDAVQNGETPLCVAAKHGSVRIIKALLNAGANVNVEVEEKRRPLNFALTLKQNQEETVKVLIAAGADIFAVDDTKSTTLHYAAETGCVEVVKLLLESSVDPNQYNNCAKTPIYKVANVEILELFLDCGADAEFCDSFDNTPLHYYCLFQSTCLSERVKICRKLLNAGADPNAISASPSDLHTPLMSALQVEICTLLTDLLVSFGADVNPEAGSNPLLHKACKSGSCANTIALLEYGARFASDSDEEECFRQMPNPPFENDDRPLDPFELYFIKMNAAGLSSSEIYTKNPLNPCTMDTEDREEYKTECEQEVEKLKLRKIGLNNLSLYKLLRRASPVYSGEMAEAVRPLVVGESRLLRDEFPVYWRLLFTNIRRGLERGELLQRGRPYFKKIPCIQSILRDIPRIEGTERIPDFPINLTDHIFSYLTEDELWNLIRALRSRKRKRSSDSESESKSESE